MSDLDLEQKILFRDALILVIDKPAGVPVHAGPGGGVNLEDGFEALRFGLPKRPHLAHRLDRDTSGCLVLGRHRKALARMGKLFESKRVDKVYLAVFALELEGEGTIDVPLAKVHKYKGWKMKVAQAGDEGAQETITDYKVLATEGGLSLVAFFPRTGRTHQLRVHGMHQFGAEILGDTLYGEADAAKESRLYLHAYGLKFPLYPNKPHVEVVAPLPDEFLSLPVVAKWDGKL